MELFSSNIKQILIFSQKKAFLIFSQMKPCTFHFKLKKMKTSIWRKCYPSGNGNPEKISCVFSK